MRLTTACLRWGMGLGLALSTALAVTPARRPCVGGFEAARFRLDVVRPDRDKPLTLSRIKILPSGYKVRYTPIDIPVDAKKDAKVTLAVSAVTTDGGPPSSLTILEMKPAGLTAEWTIPFRTGLVVFAFGPQGLDEKRMNTVVGKDDTLVSALADYASETSEIEDTIRGLTAMEDEEDADLTDLNRAPTTPTEQALYTILRALNPSTSSYNPLGAGRRVGPQTLMNKASVGFFENAGGLFPGGGALGEIKPLLFPDTDFRTAFLEPVGTQGLALCSQHAPKSRNRQVFLWARRILDTNAPSLAVNTDRSVPMACRTFVAAKITRADDWKLADRAEDWVMVPAQGGAAIPAKVRPSVQGKGFDIDLHQVKAVAGRYKLQARWDWETINVEGVLDVRPLGDLKQASLAASDLVEGGGIARVSLTGADFEFVERVTFRKPGWVQTATDIDFALPKGRRLGPQDRLDVEVDLSKLRAGTYAIGLQQADGRSQDFPLTVAAAPPRVDNLPVKVNLGDKGKRVEFEGRDLDRIASIESSAAEVEWNAKTHVAVFRPKAGAKAGDRADLALKLDNGMTARLGAALQVAAAKPRIASVKVSVPADLGIALRQGELPAGSHAGFAIRIEGATDPVTWVAGCPGTEKKQRIPAQSDVFVSLDPGELGPAGCSASAVLETEAGRSDPAPLGRVIRLPKIESFVLSDEKLPNGNYGATLEGTALETIEKAGWDAGSGVGVDRLPEPLAGEGARQQLKIGLTWPSPTPRAPLFVWLRGESEGRATTARY